MTDLFGFIDNQDGANIRTLPAEQKGSMCLTRKPLPSGTRVTFIRNPSCAQGQGWAYVSTVIEGYLLRGYVQDFRITTHLPEPAATLYEIRPGDRLEPIAASIYRKAIRRGRDLRFYESVIEHVNARSGRNGVIRHANGDLRLVEGKRIWLVSVEFANRLQGIVPSGSITERALAQARNAVRHLEDVLISVETSKYYSSSPKPVTQRTLSDAALEKLLEKLPNWDKLKQFVGRLIPEEGTPEFSVFKKELQDAGYRLEKLSNGPQPYRLRRPNGKALGNEHGALTVTEGRMVMLKVEGTSRISVHSRYRKNYLDWMEKTHGSKARMAAELRLSQGHALHHLIPDAVAQSHPLLQAALKRVKGFNIDRATNILDMPPVKTAPVTKNMQKYMHVGNHPNTANTSISSLVRRGVSSVSRIG